MNRLRIIRPPALARVAAFAALSLLALVIVASARAATLVSETTWEARSRRLRAASPLPPTAPPISPASRRASTRSASCSSSSSSTRRQDDRLAANLGGPGSIRQRRGNQRRRRSGRFRVRDGFHAGQSRRRSPPEVLVARLAALAAAPGERRKRAGRGRGDRKRRLRLRGRRNVGLR
jgi:hypothetical protein